MVVATDELCVAYRKRLAYSYLVDDDGARRLRLDYGVKEVMFDDERLFAFAERLGQQAFFEAHAAVTWGPGYAWDEVQPLLEALVDEGILTHGRGVEPAPTRTVASPLPPASCPHVRTWNLADCESLTQALSDRPIELGHLESVLPVFRVAHPALDGDDRQVGEANVFPARLRVDRETEWRVCQYAGSRYRDAAPMNVTALKAMIRHWKPILVIASRLRARMRERFGPRSGPWTIGEIYTFACVVLALPAFQLMRDGNAPLHPVLSSLFRVMDGVRMTTDDMMFAVDHSRPADEPITAAQLWAHAERYGLLLGNTGVCAGPQAMVDEFLAVVVDGVAPAHVEDVELPDEVVALLAHGDAPIDYGLYGLQANGVSLAIWLGMARAYEAVRAFAAATPGTSPAFQDRLAADWRVLVGMQLAREDQRDVHRLVYVDMYERPWRMLPPHGHATLTEELAPAPRSSLYDDVTAQLRSRLRARFPDAVEAIEPLVDALVHYLREEQAVLRSATRLQRSINQLLDRPLPRRRLEARDLWARFALGTREFRYPYVLDLIELELGLRITCFADAIELTDVRSR